VGGWVHGWVRGWVGGWVGGRMGGWVGGWVGGVPGLGGLHCTQHCVGWYLDPLIPNRVGNSGQDLPT
jgi:hypothetical protein